MSEERINDYDKIQQMHHQEYLMKKNKKIVLSKWRKAREFIETVLDTLSSKEDKLKDALEIAINALVKMQAIESNPPLKKTQLSNMNGEPVWVVSADYGSKWGIVDSYSETVLFPKSDGVDEEGWFEYNYIFRYKKVIRDYTQLLEKYGIKDE